MKNNNKSNNKGLIKVFITAISAAMFCTVIIVFGFNILNKYKTDYLNGIGREQEILVNSVSRNISEVLNAADTKSSADITSAENSAVENIVKKAESSGSRYWLFCSTEKIIYIENDNFTKSFNGMTYEELLHQYKLNGGVGIQSLTTLINSKANGTVSFSASDISPVYLASIHFITVNDKTYILGACTSSDYLLRMGDMYKNSNYIAMSSILFCLAVMVITICFSLTVYRRNNTIKQKDRDIRNKNILIEKLTQKNEDENAEFIYDDLTGLYNKTFCGSFLAKIESKNLLNVGIILIKIKNLDEINKQNGTDKGNDILIKLSVILKSLTKQQDIISRVNNNEFAIIILNTESKIIEEYSNEITRAFSINFADIYVDFEFITKYKTEKNQSLFPIFTNGQETFDTYNSYETEYVKL